MTVHIYLVAHVKDKKLCGPVKVGITANLPARLAQLRTGNPRPIDVAASLACPDRKIAAALEVAFHTVMSSRRLEGEWFDLNPHEALAAFCKNMDAALGHFLGDDPELLEASKIQSGLADLMKLLAGVDALAAEQSGATLQ